MKREKHIITEINGTDEFKSFLLGHNISVGTIFQMNYSPSIFQLVNITVQEKTLSMRSADFKNIESRIVE